MISVESHDSRAAQHDKIMFEIGAELVKADRYGATFATLHDAYYAIDAKQEDLYGVVCEERSQRSSTALRRKLIQVAAMAIKGVLSIDNFVGPK